MRENIKYYSWDFYVNVKSFFLRASGLLRQRLQNVQRIIIYHHIAPNAVLNFRRQIEYFANHYQILSLGDWIKKLENYPALKEDILCITFDDAFHSVYERAAPILDEYAIKPCIFVPVAFIENSNMENNGQKNQHMKILDYSMTWNQLRDLFQRGYEIGCHSWSHADFGRDHINFDKELNQSKFRIEHEIGGKICYFAFPFGRDVNISQEAVEKAYEYGYTKLFSGMRKPVNISHDVLPRLYIDTRWEPGILECMLKGYFDVAKE